MFDLIKLVGIVIIAGILFVGINIFVDELYAPGAIVHHVPGEAGHLVVDDAKDADTVPVADSEENLEKVEVSFAAMLALANRDAGQKVAKKCKSCHDFEEGGVHKVGPKLWGIVDAPQARHSDFGYSEAFDSLAGQWTYTELDSFITKPKAYAPGTKMSFGGIKNPKHRANLIVFLRDLSKSPRPLPSD